MNLKNKMLTGLAALVLAAGTVKADWYNYYDDFQTDKVLTDSQSHSPIFNSSPLIQVSPYIVRNGYPTTHDKWLQFFSGQTIEGDAEIVYKLPLNGTTDGIDYGVVSFLYGYNSEIIPYTRGHLKVSFSGDGINWTTAFEQNPAVLFPFSWASNINITAPNSTNQYVKIEGQKVCIDQLNIRIWSDSVPLEKLSFGDVKAMYK